MSIYLFSYDRPPFQALRHEGHDIIRASEVGQARADDQLILDKAIAEKRILVTLDEHFGDWVILPLSKHPGASNRANLGMCISYHITFTMSIYLFSYDRPPFSVN